MKYKVYIVKINNETDDVTFALAKFNPGCGYDSVEEANAAILREGIDYIDYTILPYIYMTSSV